MTDEKVSFKRWTKNNKLTAFKIHEKSGVSISTIQKLTSAGVIPHRKTLEKLQKAYPDITLAMFE